MVGSLPGSNAGAGPHHRTDARGSRARSHQLRTDQSLGDADRLGGCPRGRLRRRPHGQPRPLSPPFSPRWGSSSAHERNRLCRRACVWVTLTRALGQSALSVASLAIVGHWFVKRIDTAMAVYSVAISVGFMAAFPLVGFLVQTIGLARGVVCDRRHPALHPRATRSRRREAQPGGGGLNSGQRMEAGGSGLQRHGTGCWRGIRGRRHWRCRRSGCSQWARRFTASWLPASACSTSRSSPSEASVRTSTTRRSPSRR